MKTESDEAVGYYKVMGVSKFSLSHIDEAMVELVKKSDHKTLPEWAIDCVERVMLFFEESVRRTVAPEMLLRRSRHG